MLINNATVIVSYIVFAMIGAFIWSVGLNEKQHPYHQIRGYFLIIIGALIVVFATYIAAFAIILPYLP